MDVIVTSAVAAPSAASLAASGTLGVTVIPVKLISLLPLYGLVFGGAAPDGKTCSVTNAKPLPDLTSDRRWNPLSISVL